MLVLRQVVVEGPAAGGAAAEAIDFELRRGEFRRLGGGPASPNARLLRVIGLLERPRSGSYLLDSEEVLGRSEAELAALRARHFGFLFARDYLVPELDLLHNLLLPMGLSRMPRPLRRRRAEELLERFGLGGRARARPPALGPAEGRRLALARALANEPGLLLVEEGPGGRETPGGGDIGALLEELHGEGLGILLLEAPP